MTPAATLGVASLAGCLLAGCIGTPDSAVNAPPTLVITDRPDCPLAEADRAWIVAGQGAWAHAESAFLKLKPENARPDFILFDATCSYRSSDGVIWSVAPHMGAITTPRVRPEAVAMTAYAATARDGSQYLVMAMPSVWKTEPRFAASLGSVTIETFLTGIFVHEMTHTRHAALLGPSLQAAREAFGGGISSDTVQERFGKEPDFAASVSLERDLLFAAAKEGGAAGRAKVKQALDLIQTRRAKWYVGADARYGAVEEYFLTFEGVAQLAGYAWLASPAGAGLGEAEAFRQIHNNGGYWAGDQGFAILLVVDRFVPDWRDRVFGKETQTASSLLALAAGDQT